MAHKSDGKRIDTASRVIKAPRHIVYEALVDADAIAAWLPPEGMTGYFESYNAVVNGTYRMMLEYDAPDPRTPGKATENMDVVTGKFLELKRNERVVQEVEFESDDSAFAGKMLMTWSLTEVPEGTEVTIRCENVPEGIRPEDHAEGLQSSLENLARFIEK